MLLRALHCAHSERGQAHHVRSQRNDLLSWRLLRHLHRCSDFSEASSQKPYISLIMRIDLRSLHDLGKKAKLPGPEASVDPVGIAKGRASEELLGAFSRLVDLAKKPADAPLLLEIVQSEIYARVLQSEAGTWVMRMAGEGYRATGVVRALEWLKENYIQPLRIDELAARAAMASSTFHHNFRRLTGTSPLQYQKTLRLYAARNLMLTERVDANTAAVKVGYESVPQFSREYSRMFGAPPGRDIKAARRYTNEH
jgi:AraC-like DNA-binding protein